MEPLKFHSKLTMVAFLLQMGGREQGGRGSGPIDMAAWEEDMMVCPLEALFFLPSSSENYGDKGGNGTILTEGKKSEKREERSRSCVLSVCVGPVFNGPSPKHSAK